MYYPGKTQARRDQRQYQGPRKCINKVDTCERQSRNGALISKGKIETRTATEKYAYLESRAELQDTTNDNQGSRVPNFRALAYRRGQPTRLKFVDSARLWLMPPWNLASLMNLVHAIRHQERIFGDALPTFPT